MPWRAPAPSSARSTTRSTRPRRQSFPPVGPGRPSASTASPVRCWSSGGPPPRWPSCATRRATASPAPTGDRFRRHFRQQGAHLQHLVDGADALGNLLANALQAYLAEVSVRQNTDMRRISAWAAIWAVPTLLAGIYGMNFRHMPELSWRFGYPLVLVVMVAICLG